MHFESNLFIEGKKSQILIYFKPITWYLTMKKLEVHFTIYWEVKS